jgi:U3 small nucleolar ribonucleoprotein protein LCP5
VEEEGQEWWAAVSRCDSQGLEGGVILGMGLFRCHGTLAVCIACESNASYILSYSHRGVLPSAGSPFVSSNCWTAMTAPSNLSGAAAVRPELRTCISKSELLHVKSSTLPACNFLLTSINMATETALPDVLSSFTTAVETAIAGLPTAESLLAPENGITLLDTKNEIFLAYLQTLALRNLNVIRSVKDGSSVGKARELNEELTKKLAEHRVYLERGVRPLEGKIRYQVEKVVKAAADEERRARMAEKEQGGKGQVDEEDESEEDSGEESEDEEEEAAFRPNLESLGTAKAQGRGSDANAERLEKSKADGIYRPPRIAATAMPDSSSRAERKERPARSATVDEYIATEFSEAPAAQPSIGSTIAAGGRRTKSAKQMAEEAARREYEETNLVRLPKESKKELRKKGGRQRESGFGGEEWRGLGESVDRIADLTRRKGGKESALDRSRKRRAVEDGPRGSGSGMGDAFEAKRRRMAKRAGR